MKNNKDLKVVNETQSQEVEKTEVIKVNEIISDQATGQAPGTATEESGDEVTDKASGNKKRPKRKSIASEVLEANDKKENLVEPVAMEAVKPEKPELLDNQKSIKVHKLKVASDNEVESALMGLNEGGEMIIPDVFDEELSMDSNRFSGLCEKLNNIENMIPTFDLDADYFIFNKLGEKINVCFYGYRLSNFLDEQTQKYVNAPCVMFLKKDIDGVVRLYKNGGVQLVRTLIEMKVQKDTALEIGLKEIRPVAKGELKVYSVVPLLEPVGIKPAAPAVAQVKKEAA